MDHRTIQGYRDLQMLDVGRAIEEFLVLVGFDFIVPAQTGDGIASR
ncbi:hypothetical protein SH501x_004624 [Pirellulaceae bacterium SH501]